VESAADIRKAERHLQRRVFFLRKRQEVCYLLRTKIGQYNVELQEARHRDKSAWTNKQEPRKGRGATTDGNPTIATRTSHKRQPKTGTTETKTKAQKSRRHLLRKSAEAAAQGSIKTVNRKLQSYFILNNLG
jgi:hypothetical protein